MKQPYQVSKDETHLIIKKRRIRYYLGMPAFYLLSTGLALWFWVTRQYSYKQLVTDIKDTRNSIRYNLGFDVKCEHNFNDWMPQSLTRIDGVFYSVYKCTKCGYWKLEKQEFK